ncbi:type I methionyl aminopeptidase [Geomicrobium sp. JCM 19039]|uniref:type I methionyl aminopeptidase n=1 Tax=Geomicrobium sp. JCM 19039 TaxID=1460636 RepID=UPI00045F1FCA|nr:type I methionyl aminopeptidase [Geomicrobium sp. JCM 19039]GAK10573.1 methionine aminopeptidase [Geomicrobium sp. JCM 19039]
MIATSKKDIHGLKEAGKVISEIRDEMIAHTKPGITTKQLDEIAERMFKKYGAISAPISTYNFPGYTCICVNEEVAHGIPGDRVIQDGELVNIDVSGAYNDYWVDTGKSLIAGETQSEELEQLLKATDVVFDAGLQKFKAGAKMNGVGRAVHRTAKKLGYTVIKNLTGHGVGSSLRDEPDHIFNYYIPWDKEVFTNGSVIAYEPFVSTKAEEIYEKDDGWTLLTKERGYVAQKEHTIIVTQDEPIIVT